MHLFFYARGIEHQINLWKAFMQNHFWHWKRHNVKTGQDETILLQGALRPSVLGTYEYIFPEECLPEVLAVLGVVRQDNEEEIHLTGGQTSVVAKFKLMGLRAIIGCEEVPKEAIEQAKKINPSIVVNGCMRGLSHSIVPGVSIHTIGIKRDVRRLFPEVGYIQEAV